MSRRQLQKKERLKEFTKKSKKKSKNANSQAWQEYLNSFKIFKESVDSLNGSCRIRPHVVAEGGNRSPAKPSKHQVLQRLIRALTEVNN